MSHPKISVLIPCFNREDYIRQCVGSVINQSFRDIEVIVYDNASTDHTYEIVREIAAQDDRIKLFRNEMNLGPIPNWQCCLKEAQGDYIHWMWSDDYIESGFYETMMQSLEHSGASLALSSHKLLRDDKYEIQGCLNLKGFDVFTGKHVVQGLLARVPWWPVSPAAWLLPAPLVRKHFYTHIPVFAGYDCNQTAIGADLLMIAGCALNSERVVRCHEAYAVFRAHGGSISISRPTWRHYEVAKLWFIIKNRLERGMSHTIWLALRAARVRSVRLFVYVLVRGKFCCC